MCFLPRFSLLLGEVCRNITALFLLVSLITKLLKLLKLLNRIMQTRAGADPELDFGGIVQNWIMEGISVFFM